MIEARFELAGLFGRLAGKARSIAEARVHAVRAVRRGDPRRWRRAGWLWPLFVRER